MRTLLQEDGDRSEGKGSEEVRGRIRDRAGAAASVLKDLLLTRRMGDGQVWGCGERAGGRGGRVREDDSKGGQVCGNSSRSTANQPKAPPHDSPARHQPPSGLEQG